MLLSLLVYTRSLRFVIPTAALVGTAPQFFYCWLAWRVISSVLPRRTFELVDELFYDAYQCYVTFFFEVYNGSKVTFYGDKLPVDKKENVIYISNHQSAVDWVVSDMIAIRQGSLGSIRYVLKNGLRYLPWYGFYFAQHGCIYVKRNDKNNEKRIIRKLHNFLKNKTPLWLVIFPEGTRYNTLKPEVIKQSKEFAEKSGLQVLENVLVPRAKATQVSIEELWEYIDAVYDVTIAYHDPKKAVSPRAEGPSLTEFLADGNQDIHIYLDRIEKDRIPKTGSEIKTWIFERFEEKDKLLSRFYKDESGATFPGPTYTLPVPCRKTLIPTLGFISLFSLTMVSDRGRSLYWKWSLGSGLASLVYMALLYDAIQT